MRSTLTPRTNTTEAALLGRILKNGTKAFPPALARYLLTVGFSAEEKARMHELAVKNQEGALTPDEKEELLRYANVGCVLGILQSQARKSLKRANKKRVT
jgi:hypothetical protein